MQERDALAKQLADAITITITFGTPGTRSEIGVSLGASDGGVGDGACTKSEADYRPSSADDRRCGTCNHFDDGSCEIVSGKIDEDDVCNYWTDGTDWTDGTN